MGNDEELSNNPGQRLIKLPQGRSLLAPYSNTQPVKKTPAVRRTFIDPRYLVPRPSDLSLNSTQAFKKVRLEDLVLYIPASTKPVLGVDAGINLVAITTHAEGLLIALLPFLDMEALDFAELFWGDLTNSVASTTIHQHEVDNAELIPLFVPSSVITDGIVIVFIRVTRLGQAVGETRKFALKVDKVKPAGDNPDGHSFINKNLLKPIIPQEFLDFGVTEDDAQNCIEIRVPYYPADTSLSPRTHRALRDAVRLKIGDALFEHKVSQPEADNFDDIVFRLCIEHWRQVGSGAHVAEWNVIDECGNYSDGWSLPEFIQVFLNDGSEPLLPHCFFDEAPEDILNLDEVIGDFVSIIVLIAGFGYQLGDVIKVTLTGRTVDGQTVTKTYSSAPLTSTTTRQLRIPCPVSDLIPLIGGQARLRYERIRFGAPNRGSHLTPVSVIGTAIPGGLYAPIFREAVDGTLPADVPVVNIDIRKSHGQDFFDRITLRLLGRYPNGKFYYHEESKNAGAGNVVFSIINGPEGDIAKLAGGSLTASYTSENSQGIRPSPATTVYVGASAAVLPEPRVHEAPPPDYVFDPSQSTGDATIEVDPNNDIKVGDTVTLHAEGSGGSAPPQPFFVSDTWKDRPLPFTLERQYILPNPFMNIFYDRSRPGAATRFSNVVPMKILAVRHLPAPFVYNSTPVDDENATINPVIADNTPEVTFRVQFAPMSSADLIKPELLGKPGATLPSIPPQYGNSKTGFVDFKFPNSVIGDHIGSVLRIQYHVTTNGVTDDSRVLNLRVLDFDELPGGNPLPQPRLNGLPPDSTVDLNAFTTDCWVSLARWLLSRKDQRIWLRLHSVGATPLTLLNGHPIDQTQANNGIVNEKAMRSWFTALADGSKVTAKAAVTFDGDSNELNAKPFPLSDYVIKALRLYDLTDFELLSWNAWVNIINGTGVIRNVSNNNFWYVKLNNGSPIGPGVIKTFYIKSGKTYDLSFKMKVDLNPYQPQVFIEFGTQSDSFTHVNPGVWTSHSRTFALPAGVPSQFLPMRIYFKSTYSGAEFSLDDILVVERP
ncbi:MULTISPECIES: carbohydrate binding domain-containing protein [Pseudomonas]|uniref:CBM-cenC domain-containing protein n=1 Tax=Pseudomonas reactans TaxID=117680 RepID=A0A7Y8FXM3_9PSED|nr:hypothetical protein [Pseudomonas reactans]NWE87059.1 hypothetical protein [Pseudomonas reactans]